MTTTQSIVARLPITGNRYNDNENKGMFYSDARKHGAQDESMLFVRHSGMYCWVRVVLGKYPDANIDIGEVSMPLITAERILYGNEF